MKVYFFVLVCLCLHFNALGQGFEMHVNLSSKDQIDHTSVSANQKYLFTGCQRQNEIKIWDIQNKANLRTIDVALLSKIKDVNFYFDMNPNSDELAIFFPNIKKIVIYDFLKSIIISEHDLSNDLQEPYNRIFYCDKEKVYLMDNTTSAFELFTYNLKTRTKIPINKYLKENQLYLTYFEKTDKGIVSFFRDSTHFLAQSSNNKLLLKLKKTEAFEKILPAISKDEHYMALNFTDSIIIFNTISQTRQVIDSTRLINRASYPISSKFSDDSSKLLYLDDKNYNGESNNLIVVYDVEQNRIINKLETDEKNSIFRFCESKEQVFATKYHEIYSGYLFQNKLRKNLKGLQRQTSCFTKSGQYWFSGFDNGSINIFNAKTGESNYLKVTETKNKYAPVSSISHFDNTLIVSVQKRDDIIVYKIALNELKVLDSLQIYDNSKFKNLSIDRNKEKLWIKTEIDYHTKINDIPQKNIKNFLFDIKTFKEIPLFENNNYTTLYFTNEKKEVVGYVAQKGSFVYDSKSYKFLKFIPNSLYFKYKESDYELTRGVRDKQVKDFYVLCDKCEDGYQIKDSVFKVPSGRLILKKEGVTVMEFDNFNKNPKSDDDLFEHQVIHHDNSILFKKNGFETIHLDLDKRLVDKPLRPSKYIFKYDKPQFYLKFNTSGTEPIRNVLKSDVMNFKVSDTLQFGIYDINYVNQNYYITKELTGDFESWSNDGYDAYGNIKIQLLEKSKDGMQVFHTEDSDDLSAFGKMDVKLNSLNPKTSNSEQSIGTSGEYAKIPVLILENKIYLNRAEIIKRNSSGKIFSREGTALVALNEDYLFDEDPNSNPYNHNLSDIASFYNWDDNTMTSSYAVSWNENEIAIKGTFDDKSKINFNFIFLEDRDFIIFFDDNYYMATKEIFDFLWFSDGEKVFRPEQFDLKFNRPDIVMQRLGYAEPTTIQFFKKLYLKRLQKIGIGESQLSNFLDLPTLKIENFEKLSPVTTSKEIGLNIKIKDSKYRIKSINIWINNTPIYGKNGMDVSLSKRKKIDKTILLPLANGNNKIQISVLNEIGLESLKETVYITSKQSDAAHNLYLVTLGVSEFENTAYNLKYAAKDATDVKNLFGQSNLYTNVYTKTLLDTKVTQQNVQELEEFLKNATINDVVMIYIASHGLLDPEFNYYIASYNIDFHNPVKNGIPYENIEKLLDKVKPLKKIMFIDACHSGEVDPEETESADKEAVSGNVIVTRGAKGSNVKKKSTEQIKRLNEEMFSDLRRGNGTTIISSSGGLEYALESDKWKNGLFTYCLINGLLSKKADLNDDGNIMLSEIQNYVSDQVKELSNGLQQPTFRLKNLADDYQIW